MGKEEFASVTAAAQALGVSADTIRRWSKLGLIKSTRDKNQKRMFNLAELHRLRRKLNGEGDSTDYQILRADETFDDATCIDLFAGAGGTALGFSNAGINHVLLNEFDKNAAQALKDNSDAHGLNWVIDDRDVHDVEFSPYQAEIMQAGFPCQAFSYAGKSKGFEDTRGTLFFEFCPRYSCCAAENRDRRERQGARTPRWRQDVERRCSRRLTIWGTGSITRFFVLSTLMFLKSARGSLSSQFEKILIARSYSRRSVTTFISLKQALEGCPDSEVKNIPRRSGRSWSAFLKVVAGGIFRMTLLVNTWGAAIIFPEEEPVWRDVCRGISRV